jgi:ribosomal protein S18 acetylase RimI-like enzyme
MELKLIELNNKNDIYETYDIYKHCMFMPTEEKFYKKCDQFLNDNSVKILACFNQDTIVGVIVISFVEQRNIEIVGIAVDISTRNKGVGSYMINQVVSDYDLLSVYAETDNDAVDFYRKNGFAISKFTEIYNGETVIRYKCKLNK